MNKVWDLFNIKGGSIMGLFTLCMISLIIYVTLTQKTLDSGVVAAYSITVGAFAYSKKGVKKNVSVNVSEEPEETEPKS
jgi:TRAP-type C4-dicarboxylate transport system permease large subunit